MKLFWAVLSGACCTGHIVVAEPQITYNSFGMPGLIDMPSAQSAPDAELIFSVSQSGKSLRNTLTFQISPRLTGAFRYSAIGRPTDTLYDRSFDLRYRLLETMKTAGIKHLVFSSSATVYGEPEEVPISETAPLQFTNPYGFTKVASEQILTQAAAADPWAFGVLRYFNPAGAHPSGLIGEDPFDIPNNLMPYIAKVASGALPHLNVFGNDYDTRDGTGERDYIHVCDLAQGHVLSLQKLLSTHEGHVVNLGTGQAYSVLEMNAAYGEAVGRDLPYVIAPRRPGDVPTCLADVRKAKKVLGFETQFGLADMCQSSWNWIETQARS